MDDTAEIMRYYQQVVNDYEKNKPAPVCVGNGWLELVGHPISHVGNAKLYQKTLKDGFFNCIVEIKPPEEMFPKGRYHLSLSFNSIVNEENGNNIPKRIPTWDELKEVRYLLLPDDLNMAIMMPPVEGYVNFHKTCLHLIQIPVEYALKPINGVI